MRLFNTFRPRIAPTLRDNADRLPMATAARIVTGCLILAAGLSACGGDYNPTTAAGEGVQVVERSSEGVPVETVGAVLVASASVTAKPVTDQVADATVEPVSSGFVKTAASPTSAPVAGTVADSSPATLNSLGEIENDMALLNEGALLKVDPNKSYARGSIVIMGNDPRGTNTPSYFQPTDKSLLSADYWRAIMPWFVIFEGVGNQAINSRIHLRNFKLYYKSKRDGQWRMLGSDNQFWGTYCGQDSNYAGCGGPAGDKRAEPDGGMSIRPVQGYNFHGWWTRGHVSIQPDDIAAIFVTGQMRLVRDNASTADDRAKAKYLLDTGADYYPYANYDWGSQANPGVGISRAKYVTSEWRPFNMMTFSDVGPQWPGGGITRAEFYASPPPLE